MYTHYVLLLVMCILIIILLYHNIKPTQHQPMLLESFQDAKQDDKEDTEQDAEQETKQDAEHKPMSKRSAYTVTGLLKTMGKISNLDSAIGLLHKVDGVRASLTPFLNMMDPKPTDDHEVVTVLWSGGVASTFRICELLFVYKKTVRPLYMEQTDLDERQSYTQERSTVKALHQYIQDTRKDVDNRLLPVEMYESPLRDTKNNAEIRKHLSFIFNVPPEHIDNYYLYLIKLRGLQNKPHTELSSKAIELVLPEDGPHEGLRKAVERWGTRFIRKTKKNPANHNTPQIKQYECTFVVTEPRQNQHGNSTWTIEQQQQQRFAQLFDHIHFILPCQPVIYRPFIIDKYKLNPIMKRAWSCRQPVLTTHQKIIQQNKINKRNLLHRSYPIGYCNMCVSCQQRHKDGIERIPPNLFNKNKK